jgi:hypothetical protein
MHLNGDIGGVDEESLQVLDVLGNSSRLVAIRPGDDDVPGVTLPESVPFLVAKDVEVERVERLEIGFNGGGQRLGVRRWELRMLRGRLCRRGHARQDSRYGRYRY